MTRTIEQAGTTTSVRHARLIIVATVLGVMMDAIDLTAVAVANPVIAVDLGTVLPDLQWVTNGYILALASLLIIAGKVSDVFGHKRVFIVGLAGFAIASAFVGMSDTVPMMVASRVAQGVFGSVLIPSSLAILRLAFPPDQLKKAVALWGAGLALAGAAGPLIAGVLVNYLGWRWVFFINLPIAVVAVVLAATLIPRRRPESDDRSLDLPGVVLLSVTLASLVWAIIRLPETGLRTPAVPLAFVVAAVFLALFLVREGRARAPLLPLRLFRMRGLSPATAVLLVPGFIMNGTLFYLAFYLQQVHGLTALQAGIALAPAVALFSIGAPLGATLNQRYGPKVPITFGLLVVAISVFALSRLEPHTSIHYIWPFLAPLGLGVGAFNPTAVTVIVSAAPARLAGTASGLQQTAVMVGAALATSTLGMVLSFRVGDVLYDRLTTAGVPEDISSRLSEASGQFSQGMVQLPADIAPEYTRAITEAAHLAFTDGLRVALMVVAAIAAIAAVFAALFITPPEEPDEDEQTTAATGT